MKKYSFLILVLILVLAFSLSACNSADYGENNAVIEGDIPEDGEGGFNVAERKIIYKASLTLNTSDLKQTVNKIKSAIGEDEWFDEESVSGGSAYFVARVKSNRLDEFIAAVSEGGKVYNLNKTATDVSLDYFNIEGRIASLNAERERLLELFDEATMSDMIQINTRIAQIDRELQQLQGDINNYDSLIEYSEVRIDVYEAAQREKAPFGQRAGNVFKGAWQALKTFFEWLVIAVIAVFPFAVVIVPIVLGAVFLSIYIKKIKKKKAAEQQKIQEQQISEQKTPEKPQE